MKKMKLLALTLCVGLTLCACGNKAETVTENTEASQETNAEENNDATDEAEETTPETTDEQEDVDTEETDGDNTSDDGDDADATDAKSLADVFAEIKASVELNELMEPGEDFIFNYYGINMSEYEEYIFAVAAESTSADAVIMVKTNGADQADSIKASLESYISEKEMELQDYLPAEYDIVKASSVVIKGDYVYLVISHNAADVTSIIENNL